MLFAEIGNDLLKENPNLASFYLEYPLVKCHNNTRIVYNNQFFLLAKDCNVVDHNIPKELICKLDQIKTLYNTIEFYHHCQLSFALFNQEGLIFKVHKDTSPQVAALNGRDVKLCHGKPNELVFAGKYSVFSIEHGNFFDGNGEIKQLLYVKNNYVIVQNNKILFVRYNKITEYQIDYQNIVKIIPCENSVAVLNTDHSVDLFNSVNVMKNVVDGVVDACSDGEFLFVIKPDAEFILKIHENGSAVPFHDIKKYDFFIPFGVSQTVLYMLSESCKVITCLRSA